MGVRSRYRSGRGVYALAGFALLLASCGGSDATQTTLDPGQDPTASSTADPEPSTTGDPGNTGPQTVKFLKSNSWDAGTGGGFFSAQAEGFFADEGLEVEPIVALGAATSIAALVSGSADIGQTTPDALMNGLAQGADLVAVWNWLQPGIFGVMVRTDHGIDTISDLAGKRLGVIGRSSATLFNVQAALAEQGMSEEDLGDVVSLNCCSAQYTELKAGNVDAIGTWDGQVLTIQQTAAAEGATDFLDNTKVIWNENYMGDILVTTRKFYEEHPDAVEGFLRGLQRAQEFQQSQPEAALQNAADNIEGVDASGENDLAQMKLRADSYTADGLFDLERMYSALELYNKIGLTQVHPGALDLERIFVNDIAERVGGG